MLAKIAIQHQTLVFRTSVNSEQQGNLIQSYLLAIEGVSEVSFDLEDWENVLRVVGDETIESEVIENCLSNFGVEISELE